MQFGGGEALKYHCAYGRDFCHCILKSRGHKSTAFFLVFEQNKEEKMSNGIIIKVKPEIITEAMKKGVEKINIEIILKEENLLKNNDKSFKEYGYSGVETLSMRI